MSVIFYDLLLVGFGIILGIVVSGPLKRLFTGKHKEDARQKKRVKLLLYIRENTSKIPPTTEELSAKVFSDRLDLAHVHKLLEEVEDTGLIKGVQSKDTDPRQTKWVYLKK
ncbi:hypothetical protein [Bacillus sp. FJAT-45037]|uniref:hypothetical protein n=1 Tax=Bacillus sp. FJAT-45037 TaxID=2011007 RepID=UPI000C24EF0D|nr:hypothetical protein [Bacillus sp. FJAT-45037]